MDLSLMNDRIFLPATPKDLRLCFRQYAPTFHFTANPCPCLVSPLLDERISCCSDWTRPRYP